MLLGRRCRVCRELAVNMLRGHLGRARRDDVVVLVVMAIVEMPEMAAAVLHTLCSAHY